MDFYGEDMNIMGKDDKNIKYDLKANCSKCFGLCCTALYFSKTEGFPQNKEARKPCLNLEGDFRCKVHDKLDIKGLKGCMAYECLGAGQKVAQVTYKGDSWRKNEKKSKEMFDVFTIMIQLHEMMWYLSEAFRIQRNDDEKRKVELMLEEIDKLTRLDAKSILDLNIEQYRKRVNKLLLITSEQVRKKYFKGHNPKLNNNRKIAGRFNFMGANLKGQKLAGENLSGSLFIAANLTNVDFSGSELLGSDFRDANLSGANLSKSLYLTQAQINAAKGDSNTKLPKSLTKPLNW